MLEVFLLRHAKATRGNGKLTDAERPLSQRGRRQAAAMAPALVRWCAFEGEIVASPSRRTRETLEAIARQLSESCVRERASLDEALYTFDGEALRAWLQALSDDIRQVLVVGHNPALRDLARWLAREAPDALPTGGLLHLTLPVESWQTLKKHCAERVVSLTPEQASHALFQRRAPKPPDLGKADLGRRIRELLTYQYRMVRALEPGVIAGVDPEFLHQYRVNLRRSRALGEAVLAIARGSRSKKQSSSKELPDLKQQLKPLKRRAQATSDLRDLDVFLESLDKTPPPLTPRIRRALQRWLQARHREQHEALCQQLGDPGYAEEMLAWQDFLASEGFERSLHQLSPKRRETVLARRSAGHDRDLAGLTPESDDEAFHDLRKSVKRIRYLGELDPKRRRDLLAGWKHRQALLGHLQDLCTRQAWIGAFVADSRNAPRRKEECHAWRAALEKEKRALRGEIMALAPLAS